MTYVVGGASESKRGHFGAVCLPPAALWVWLRLFCPSATWSGPLALPRDWIHRNKTTTDNPVTDALDLAVKGVDDAISYASRSLWNAVVTVYTTMNLSTWWPVTAIAWITA